MATSNSNLTTSKILDILSQATGSVNSNTPSASWARTQNAYYSAGAGQPATGGSGTYAENRGADLYHTQSQEAQQQNLDNLLNIGNSYSTVAGQQQQGEQFDQTLAQQQANDLWNQLFQEKQLSYSQQQAKNKNKSTGNYSVTGYDPTNSGNYKNGILSYG